MKTALALLALTPLFAAATTAEDLTGGGSGESTTKRHPHDGLSADQLRESEIRVNGIEGIKYNVPTTVSAFDAIAKKDGAALEAALKQTLFHGSYGNIRAGVTDAIIARTDLVKSGETTPTLFKPKLTTGKGIEVVETYEGEGNDRKLSGYVSADGKKTFKPDTEVKVEADGAFFTRVVAELGVEANFFKDLVQQVANETPFDPSRKERTAASRKIAKAYIETAQGVIAAGQHERLAKQLADLLERDVDVSDTETRELVLATAIADNELKEKREREAALKNKYLQA